MSMFTVAPLQFALCPKHMASLFSARSNARALVSARVQHAVCRADATGAELAALKHVPLQLRKLLAY